MPRTGLYCRYWNRCSVKKSKKDLTLARESERVIAERIAALLALPMRKRMNFLRKRLPGGGSVL